MTKKRKRVKMARELRRLVPVSLPESIKLVRLVDGGDPGETWRFLLGLGAEVVSERADEVSSDGCCEGLSGYTIWRLRGREFREDFDPSWHGRFSRAEPE